MDASFKMPFSGQRADVTFDDSATADEVINTFINQGLLTPPRPSEMYGLAINGGHKIIGNQTLAAAGAIDGSVIDVIVTNSQG